MVDKVALFALVKETTQAAQELKVQDRIKASQAVSEKTSDMYKRVAARRMNLRSDEPGQLMDGVSARSWHATRAALLHVASVRYGEAKRACDQAQRAGDFERAEEAAILASRAIEVIKRIESAERPELTGKRASKRRSLPKSDIWQQVVYQAATPVQQPAIAVMWATGCRPAELEAGVEVRHAKDDGKPVIAVIISGAKVTESSGQPRRVIAVDPQSPAGQALLQTIPAQQSGTTIRRSAKRLNADLADIREKTQLKISPYSFRHQVAANAKTEMSAEKVAAAMGHAATRSQNRYGSVRQAQSGGTGIQAVVATRPVRETRPQAPAPASRPQPL